MRQLRFVAVGQRLVEGLQELWASTGRLLGEVQADEWSLPTPCSDWDVRQLAAHIAGGQSSFEGFAQPELPPGWTTDKQGVDELTARGVASRADWSPQQIIDELSAASSAQVDRLRQLDEAGWEGPAGWPPGDPTERGFAKNRLLDAYIHLLDLRIALGRPLDLDTEPTVFELSLEQAFEFSGWGAVKKAGITDDCRIRLDLHGRGGGVTDLVVEERRGRLEPPREAPSDRLDGSTTAFLFAAVDRRAWWDIVGPLAAEGEAARRFSEDYVIWP